MKWISASKQLPKDNLKLFTRWSKSEDGYLGGWHRADRNWLEAVIRDKPDLNIEWLDESTPPEKTYSEEERDKFAADILRFISEWDTQYSVMYGKQAERFADLETDYTPEQIIEIYKSKQ